MKIRSLILTAVTSAFCLCMGGCDSGGVDAISASTTIGPNDPAAAAASGTAPKALPSRKRKSTNEAPGPMPAPEI